MKKLLFTLTVMAAMAVTQQAYAATANDCGESTSGGTAGSGNGITKGACSGAPSNGGNCPGSWVDTWTANGPGQTLGMCLYTCDCPPAPPKKGAPVTTN